MKAGINVWTWGFKEKGTFEQALREVGDLRYQAVENISAIADLYQDNPAEFIDLVASHGLEYACSYHHFSGDYDDDVARAEKYLAFMKKVGASIMNLQGARRPEDGPTREDLTETAKHAARIGEMAADAGVTLCLHPHYATMIEQADELAYMMDKVSDNLLKLTIDTAHSVLGGMDPVETFSTYAERVRYVHMKDIVPVTDPSVPWWSGFRELGRGIVNFPAIVDILGGVGFTGVLCVEMDRPRVCGYKSAAISRQYLREEFGL
jgi:inosose dehydratase